MSKFFALSVTILVFALGTELTAKSWSDVIEEVEAHADKIWELGISLGAQIHLGTAVNELDIPRHQCAILGRMLGHQSAIQELEQNDMPPLSNNPSEDELHALMLYSQSQSNWAFVARAMHSSNLNERRHSWNLNCVGKMGIPGNLFEVLEKPGAGFEVDGADLRVLGDVELGFFDQLSPKLIENPQVKRVVLGSGGGNVSEAIRAGQFIRETGLETTLSDNCFSACTLVFLGGVKRTIWSPYSLLGFHKVSDGGGTAIAKESPAYQFIFNYSAEMGVDAEFVLRSMWAAEPNQIYEPQLLDLCKHWVATWIQRACFGGEEW